MSKLATPTIAITSIGSLVGSAILDSLEHRRAEFRVIGYNSIAEAINNFRADSVHLLPPAVDENRYRDALRHRITQDRPDIVLAGRDEDIRFLAALRTEATLDDVTIVAPSPGVVDILHDKFETYRFARDRDLPFARSAITRADAEALVKKTGFPIIVKRRTGGHASRDVFICRDDDEFARVLETGDTFLFQEFLDPPGDLDEILPSFDLGMPLFFAYPEKTQYSAQLLLDTNGQILSSFSVVSHFVQGRSVRVDPVTEPALDAIGIAYARALAEIGFFGPLNVQCKKTGDGSFSCFELNGRFVGGTFARALLGYREVEYLVDYVTRGRRPTLPIQAKSDTFILRPPTSVVISADAVRRLERDGRWTA